MKRLSLLVLWCAAVTCGAADFQTKRDVRYLASSHERHVLDIHAPAGARQRPVIFWIHGGGWQAGDKTSVQEKPAALTARGYVFVSTNYRLLPQVDMGTLVGDVADALRWVHENIAEHGGDPNRIFVMGHSAGAQLAALLCTDERLLDSRRIPRAALKGCVPVDGDTYDIPAIVATGEVRRRLHGQPEPKYGHRAKFGTETQHREFSAVTHVARGKQIPPFLLLHTTENPDTTAQAQRLASVLKAAGVPARVVGIRDATHNGLNAGLGREGDTATRELYAFLDSPGTAR